MRKWTVKRIADCKKCVSEKVCRYNDGHNLYCKEDYECPHFTEVVKCKNCRNKRENSAGHWCELHSTTWDKLYIQPDDFCSYGRRKGE